MAGSLKREIKHLAVLLALGFLSTACQQGAQQGAIDVDDDDTVPDDPCTYGNALFDASFVHTIELTFSDSDWAEIIEIGTDACEYCDDPRPYFPAAMTVDGFTLDGDVGVRLKGHSSLMLAEGHSYPFKVDFNEYTAGQQFQGLKKVNLHQNRGEASNIVEYAAYKAIRDHRIDGTTPVPAPRTAFVCLTVNGEGLGKYNAVEQIGGAFLDCHFPEPRGHLYKPEEPSEHLALPFETYEAYSSLHFKWGPEELLDPQPEVNHGAVGQMVNTIHEGLPALETVLDTDGVLLYHAVNVGLGNHDYYGSYGHNYYLYESTPGVFTMVAWDLNEAFSIFEAPCGDDNEGKPLNEALLRDPQYVDRYAQILAEFLGHAIPSVEASVDHALTLLGDEMDLEAFEEIREETRWGMEEMLDEVEGGMEICD